MNPARSMCGWTRPESGALADRADPAVRGAPIEPLAVVAAQDRPFVTFADRRGRSCGRCAAPAGSWPACCPCPTMRKRAVAALEGRGPRRWCRTLRDTRSPLRPSSTASAAWHRSKRSAVNRNVPSSVRSMPWPLGRGGPWGVARTGRGWRGCVRRCGRTGRSRTPSTVAGRSSTPPSPRCSMRHRYSSMCGRVAARRRTRGRPPTGRTRGGRAGRRRACGRCSGRGTPPPRAPPRRDPRLTGSSENMQVTWIGHGRPPSLDDPRQRRPPSTRKTRTASRASTPPDRREPSTRREPHRWSGSRHPR